MSENEIEAAVNKAIAPLVRLLTEDRDAADLRDINEARQRIRALEGLLKKRESLLSDVHITLIGIRLISERVESPLFTEQFMKGVTKQAAAIRAFDQAESARFQAEHEARSAQ